MNKGDQMKRVFLWAAIVLIVFFGIVALFNISQHKAAEASTTTTAFSELVASLNGGRIADATISGNIVSGHLKDGTAFSSYVPANYDMLTPLIRSGAKLDFASADDVPSLA